jgi:antiviral helicase SKI2
MTLANIQIDNGLQLDPTEFVKEHINVGLIEVVYAWAKGVVRASLPPPSFPPRSSCSCPSFLPHLVSLLLLQHSMFSPYQSFSEITTLTDVPEGTIIRTIVRLDETCRDFKSAARIIGDPGLASKMEEASQLIKRDIVFASSLYVT